MKTLSKLVIGLSIALLLFASCEKDEDEFNWEDHLVNTSWWGTTECSEYQQLHFESDKTGFLTNEVSCDNCSYILRFNWSVDNSGVVTVTYTEYAMSCASDVYGLPGTEITSATKSSVYLYGMQWTTR
mgnify:CR=1 FL=1